jgi:hypothetical protein
VLQKQGKKSEMATLAANEVAGYSNFIKAQGFLDYLKKFELNDQSEFYPIIYKICSHLNSKEELEELANHLADFEMSLSVDIRSLKDIHGIVARGWNI